MSGYIDMNDPEVIESLKFLLVPREERIRMQAQPFDAKKACWVPDPKEGFIGGEIEKTDKDMVTVKTEKGEVINKNIYFNQMIFSILSNKLKYH
jgi:hypothetical protein